MLERRRASRVTPPKPIRAKLKTALTGRVVDISSSGVQVELPYSLPLRSRCDMRLQMEDGDVFLKAVVRRCAVFGRTEEDGKKVLLYRAGLEFESSSRDVLEILGPKIPLLLAKPEQPGPRHEKNPGASVARDIEMTIEVVHEQDVKGRPDTE